MTNLTPATKLRSAWLRLMGGKTIPGELRAKVEKAIAGLVLATGITR